MFERLLIPLDFSPPSVHALHTARLHFPGARRLLLHIPGPERTHAPSALDLLESGTLLSEESDLARERLEQLAIEGEETQVATGLTAETILDAAQTCRTANEKRTNGGPGSRTRSGMRPRSLTGPESCSVAGSTPSSGRGRGDRSPRGRRLHSSAICLLTARQKGRPVE